MKLTIFYLFLTFFILFTNCFGINNETFIKEKSKIFEKNVKKEEFAIKTVSRHEKSIILF